MIKKAELKSFSAGTYLATVRMSGSLATWLQDIPVSRAIPSGEMLTGRTVFILFADPSNASDAMIVGVH